MIMKTKLEPFTTFVHICSLNGKMDKITVLEKVEGDPHGTYYIAQYGDIKCTAIFNPFVWDYYADDKYGRISEEAKQ